MAFIPVPDTVLIEIRGLWNSQQVENTLYFEKDSAVNETDLVSLTQQVIDWWQVELSPYMSIAFILNEVKGTLLDSDTAPTYTNSIPGGSTGEATTEVLPGNVAACITFRTAGRGRSSRGRNYLAGLTVEFVNGNLFTVGYTGGVSAAYATLASVVTGLDFRHVVVSRYNNNAPRVTGETFPVTSWSFTDLNVDSQRRRLNGRGT